MPGAEQWGLYYTKYQLVRKEGELFLTAALWYQDDLFQGRSTPQKRCLSAMVPRRQPQAPRNLHQVLVREGAAFDTSQEPNSVREHSLGVGDAVITEG